MSQKKSKEQTPTEEIVSRSERFVEKNISKMLIGLLVVVALVAAFIAYGRFVKKPKAEKAAAAVFVAEDKFMSGQDSAALYGADGNIGLLEVAKKYSGTSTGNVAHAYAGICLYDMGKYAEAIDELKKFSAKEKLVAPSVERLIGDCYVQMDKYVEAAKQFEKAAKAADNDVISPSCLIKAGHVYEKLKQYDKALAAYNTILDKYYTAPEAEAVKADIVRVQALKK